MDTEERIEWAVLHAAQVPSRARAVVRQGGGPRHFLGAAVRARTSRFVFSEADVRRRLAAFCAAGGQIVGGADVDELGRLSRTSSPPLCAYVRGPADLLSATPAVAVVGTRAPTDDGRLRARLIAAALARAGVTVVSGGAFGIDMAAHEAALSAGGQTVVVGGAPVGHPQEMPERVAALVSVETEGRLCAVAVHAASVPMAPGLFVSRNRYIAALADAVVVVEGRSKSGTLHTARAAQKMGISVYAVPGPPESALCRAPNQLLASGAARALLDIEELIDAVGGHRGSDPADTSPGKVPAGLLEWLQAAGGEACIDDAASALGWPVQKVHAEALHQELFGALKREGAMLRLRS